MEILFDRGARKCFHRLSTMDDKIWDGLLADKLQALADSARLAA
jgi:hypothetical protein